MAEIPERPKKRPRTDDNIGERAQELTACIAQMMASSNALLKNFNSCKDKCRKLENEVDVLNTKILQRDVEKAKLIKDSQQMQNQLNIVREALREKTTTSEHLQKELESQKEAINMLVSAREGVIHTAIARDALMQNEIRRLHEELSKTGARERDRVAELEKLRRDYTQVTFRGSRLLMEKQQMIEKLKGDLERLLFSQGAIKGYFAPAILTKEALNSDRCRHAVDKETDRLDPPVVVPKATSADDKRHEPEVTRNVHTDVEFTNPAENANHASHLPHSPSHEQVSHSRVNSSHSEDTVVESSITDDSSEEAAVKKELDVVSLNSTSKSSTHEPEIIDLTFGDSDDEFIPVREESLARASIPKVQERQAPGPPQANSFGGDRSSSEMDVDVLFSAFVHSSPVPPAAENDPVMAAGDNNSNCNITARESMASDVSEAKRDGSICGDELLQPTDNAASAPTAEPRDAVISRRSHDSDSPIDHKLPTPVSLAPSNRSRSTSNATPETNTAWESDRNRSDTPLHNSLPPTNEIDGNMAGGQMDSSNSQYNSSTSIDLPGSINSEINGLIPNAGLVAHDMGMDVDPVQPPHLDTTTPHIPKSLSLGAQSSVSSVSVKKEMVEGVDLLKTNVPSLASRLTMHHLSVIFLPGAKRLRCFLCSMSPDKDKKRKRRIPFGSTEQELLKHVETVHSDHEWLPTLLDKSTEELVEVRKKLPNF